MALDENLEIVAEYFRQDNNLRNNLINNLGQFGERGMYELSEEIVDMLQRQFLRETDIPKQRFNEKLSNKLFEVYQYGMIRYIDDYDKSKLDSDRVVNQEAEVQQESINRHTKLVMSALEELNKKPSDKNGVYWDDFANRSYRELENMIGNEFGYQAVATLDRRGSDDIKDTLKRNLNRTLHQTYEKSYEDVRSLDNVTNKLETNNKEVTYSSNAAAFK